MFSFYIPDTEFILLVCSHRKTLSNMLKQVQAGPDEKIYATDVSAKGAKVFYAKNLPSMWSHMQSQPRHHYEVVRDAPCHLFWDLTRVTCCREWRNLRAILNKVFRSMGIQVEHVLLDASSDKKNSLHVITKSNKYLLESPAGEILHLHSARFSPTKCQMWTRASTPETDASACSEAPSSGRTGYSKANGPWNTGSTRSYSRARWAYTHWGLPRQYPHPCDPQTTRTMPKCVMDVLEWADASSYTWKIDLEGLEGTPQEGHVQMGQTTTQSKQQVLSP